MQVLSSSVAGDGVALPPELSGWKDTVYVAPGTSVRLLVPFGRHVDPHVPYMFHCHLLRHEEAGMMGQFMVVAPGQRAGRPPGARPPLIASCDGES